jgi:trigger factor
MADKDTATTDAVEPEVEEEVAVPALDGEEEFQFVEDPAFEIDYKGDCAYEVGVTVPVANESKQSEELFDELKSHAEVPGFRKGRVPKLILERRFGKAIRSDVEGRLVSAAFRKLIADEELRPLKVPDVDGLEDDETERGDDDPLKFTLKFEVMPRVELGSYRGVAVERPVVTVDKSDIDEALEESRMRNAVFETLEKGKSKDGDQVVIDFRGTIDDDQEFQGGTASDYPYILGSQHFFPEFEEVLAGCKAGDELSCEVTLPDTTPNEDLRGKKATFAITVKELKRRKPPKLDNDFAKQAGFDDLKALRASVKEQLQSNSSGASQQVAEARALQAVIDASTFEIPQTMLTEIAEDQYQNEVRRLMSQRVPLSQIEGREEELREQAKTGALREMQELTVLNQIGDAENVEVTEADFEAEIASVAERAGTPAEAVTQYIQEEESRRNSYEDRIFRAKSLKVIMDNAEVTDKEVPRDEMEDPETK